MYIRRSAYFSGVSLRRTDLEAILGFLVDVSELEFDEPYPPAVVARLGDLVPNDCLAYQEVDVRARRTTALIGVDGSVVDDEDDELHWELGPCPMIRYRTETGDLATARMSDVTDRRRYVESAFYREYFRPSNVEYMVDLGLPAVPGRLRSFILFRGRGDRDFTERDRVVLDALRPHFARLEAQAALRRRLLELHRQQVPHDEPGPAAGLTSREREIVAMVAQGKTNAQIAAELWVAPSTVKKHLEHVYEKLGVGRRAAAATYAGSFR